jgi:hypothetical protein
MKIRLVLLLLMVGSPVTGLAQGTFLFSNSPDSLVMYQTNSGPDYWQNPQFAPVPVGGGGVQVLWAPVGTTEHHLFQPVGPATPIAVVAGRFLGGTRTIPAGTGFSGIAPGAEVALMVRGWRGPATTWEEAAFGFNGFNMLGWSAIFNLDTGDPTLNPQGVPGQMAAVFPGLNIVYIPEPSALALAGLGAAVLVLFRRRK